MTGRTLWLCQDDDALLAECCVDTYRASGPGGQKRNKTSSAVRLRHGPSGILSIATESRSQHINKRRALRRLRMALALNLRERLEAFSEPPAALRLHLSPHGRIEISRRNADYPRVVAVVLDAVATHRGRLREAASLLGVSTAQLSRFLGDDGKVLDIANRVRRDAGLRPLRSM
ncbi:MAG: peptide chain release factor-like protein [Phycisphaerae bacterium]